jgi:hypothetical protein
MTSADEEGPALPSPVLPLPREHRSNYMPVVELGRKLGELLALNVGLAEYLPQFIWRAQPAPLPACRDLDHMLANIEAIAEKAAEARATCLFLWEIASQEAEHQREAEHRRADQ